MSPERPRQASLHSGDEPDQDLEATTKDSAEAVAQQEAKDAGAEAPKKRRTRKKAGEPEAEGTAAAQTGVDKAAAEAAIEDKPAKAKSRSKAKAKAKPAEDEEQEKAQAEEPKPARRKRAAKEEPEEEAAPAPAPRRPDGTPVLVRAQARYVRSSARKARLVCDHIRGKPVAEARSILAFSPRSVARDWAKVLESAVANAEHNHELIEDDLRVAAAYADEGPTLKRYRPRAMGRATRIRKRTSHLTIALSPTTTKES